MANSYATGSWSGTRKGKTPWRNLPFQSRPSLSSRAESGFSTAGSMMWSSPNSAARVNRAMRCPGSGCVPFRQRRSIRLSTRRSLASPRDDSPAASLNRSRRSGKSKGKRDGSIRYTHCCRRPTFSLCPIVGADLSTHHQVEADDEARQLYQAPAAPHYSSPTSCVCGLLPDPRCSTARPDPPAPASPAPPAPA